MNQRVFISYNVSDRELLRPVTTWLRAADPAPAEIVDPVGSLSAAHDVRSAIRDSIATCDSMVVIWSDRAAHSRWVHYEIGIAKALGKPIVIVLAGGSPAALPQELSDAQKVRLDAMSA